MEAHPKVLLPYGAGRGPHILFFISFFHIPAEFELFKKFRSRILLFCAYFSEFENEVVHAKVKLEIMTLAELNKHFLFKF